MYLRIFTARALPNAVALLLAIVVGLALLITPASLAAANEEPPPVETSAPAEPPALTEEPTLPPADPPSGDSPPPVPPPADSPAPETEEPATTAPQPSGAAAAPALGNAGSSGDTGRGSGGGHDDDDRCDDDRDDRGDRSISGGHGDRGGKDDDCDDDDRDDDRCDDDRDDRGDRSISGGHGDRGGKDDDCDDDDRDDDCEDDDHRDRGGKDDDCDDDDRGDEDCEDDDHRDRGDKDDDCDDDDKPKDGEAQIIVRVGGDRSGLGVTPLQGVALRLVVSSGSGHQYDASNVVTEPWGICYSDASGDCTFTVPVSKKGDERYWVIGHTAIPGWSFNHTLRTGGSESGQSQLTPYRFLTPKLADEDVVRSGIEFMNANTANESSLARDDSHGVWQLSRTNPMVDESCGLDIALVLDFSGSIGSRDDAMVTAAAALINSLQGTDSSAAIYSFAEGSPAAGAQNYPMAPINTASQASSVIAQFANGSGPGYTARWQPGGGTNWDEALRAVAASNASAGVADFAIVLTDGNPTISRNLSGNRVGAGYWTEFHHVEAGIYTANQVKAQGTRIVAMGVGAAFDSYSESNLAAISGPLEGSDYFRAKHFEQAAQQLRSLALGACAGSVTVTKMVVPEGGDMSQAQAAGGWVFDASATNGVTIAPNGTTAADTGAVNFPLTYPGGATGTTVTLTERQQSGYELVPQGSGKHERNASCWVTGSHPKQYVTVTNSGPLGFTVDVAPTQSVSCTVYNRDLPDLSTIEVDKLWVINGGTPIPDSQQPSWLSATLGLTGQQAAQWGQVHDGYEAGDTVKVSETVAPLPAWLPGCVIDARTITEINGTTTSHSIAGASHPITLIAGANHATVTNSVTCETRLTLVKSVQGGNAVPSDWTLTASGTGGPFSGASGAAAVTGAAVTADATYALSESGGPAVYAQQGEWVCLPLNAGGAQAPGSGWNDTADASVAVPLGMHVSCTVTNATAQITLLKLVENSFGGTLTAADFSLLATPAAGTGGDPTPPAIGPITGSSAAGAANTALVRPGHQYSLTEDMGAYAYLGSAVQQYTGPMPATAETLLVAGNWTALTEQQAAAVSVDANGHEIYRFVNRDAPAYTLPLTGGIGADAYWIGGAAALLLALLAGAVYSFTSRRLALRAQG